MAENKCIWCDKKENLKFGVCESCRKEARSQMTNTEKNKAIRRKRYR